MLRFLSFATLTQIAIVASQLVLLPLQIHVWGHEKVALWLSTLALAGILNVSDLGLRNAGFAALARNEPPARFATLWTIMRGHLALGALGVLGVVMLWLAPRADAEGPLYLYFLTVAAAAEVFLGVRVTMMEARGLIAPAEALFLSMAAMRVIIGTILLGFFQASPLILAIFWLVTVIAAIVGQSVFAFVRKIVPVFGNWGFEDPRRAYADAAWSAATPLVSWAQVQAPVLALSAFAAPALVASFVAIRALFGLMRGVLQNLGRIASIKFTEWAKQRGEGGAQGLLLLAGAFSAWLALGFGLALFAEQFMITSKLFALPDDPSVHAIALAATFSTVLSVHSLFTTSFARFGKFAQTGVANYGYSIAIGVSCVLAAVMNSVPLLLAGIVLSDAALLVTIVGITMRGHAEAESRGAQVTFFAAMGVYLVVAAATWFAFLGGDRPGLNIPRLVLSEAMSLVIWIAVGGMLWLRTGPTVRGLWTRQHPAPAE